MEFISKTDRDLLSVISDLLSIVSSLGIFTTVWYLAARYKTSEESTGRTRNHGESTNAEEGWSFLNLPVYKKYKRLTGTITDIKKTIKEELKAEVTVIDNAEA